MDLTSFRHDLHCNPETGLNLPRTAAKVAEVLRDAGLDVTEGVGGSGVVATLNAGDDKPAIGLRADMDALPITEANSFSHKSTIEGLFHGCGHDGHTTMLLGAALEMVASPPNKTVQFIFQPDEETGHGAQAMIDDGLFDRFRIDAVYGLHNMPGMALNQFATQSGPFCAFEDNFEVHVQGIGGHASMPEVGIDPIVVGAEIVGQLQTIPSRSISAKDHAVVSVTEFVTDGARNILASNVWIKGDCRGFTMETSNTIQTRMRAIADGAAHGHSAQVNVEYATSFKPLVNDAECTARLSQAANQSGQINDQYGRVGFSEDFAAFLQHRPGAFVLMGNGTQGNHAQPLHNPSYDFNDAAIPHGIAFWRALVDAA